MLSSIRKRCGGFYCSLICKLAFLMCGIMNCATALHNTFLPSTGLKCRCALHLWWYDYILDKYLLHILFSPLNLPYPGSISFLHIRSGWCKASFKVPVTGFQVWKSFRIKNVDIRCESFLICLISSVKTSVVQEKNAVKAMAPCNNNTSHIGAFFMWCTQTQRGVLLVLGPQRLRR